MAEDKLRVDYDNTQSSGGPVTGTDKGSGKIALDVELQNASIPVTLDEPIDVTLDEPIDTTVDLDTAAVTRGVVHTSGTVGTSPATIVLTDARGFRFQMADSASAGMEIYIRGTTTGTPTDANAFTVRKGREYSIWMQPGETMTVTFEYVGSVASVPFYYEVWS